MKKSTLFVAALAFGMTTAFAQDLTSKKGESYLPEEGDYAIGIDAYPMLNYFGNMFNGTQNNLPFGWNYTNANAMITGKMFTSPTTAYRVALRIGFTSTSATAMIADPNSTATYPTLPAMNEDQMKMSSRFIGLGGGMEWRRGNTRLQGYWGGMAMIWMAGSKETYEYGNALTTTSTPGAVSTNWGNNINPAGTTYGGNARVLSDRAGSTFGVGIRGFIGAEYFILPKLSIGGEFGWGFGFSSTGRGEIEYEAVGGAPASVNTITEETGNKGSGLWIDTDNNAFGMAPAAILVHFHF